MSNFCGVDPGVEGAYAILDESGNIITVRRLPTIPLGKGLLVDAHGLVADLHKHNVIHTAIENVATRPRQGVSSSGTFMRAVGAVWGAAQVHGGPGSVTWVTPQVWKRRFGLIGTDKEASRAVALNIWPNQQTLFEPKRLLQTKQQAQDLAEAALIARWYWSTRGRTVRQLMRLGLPIEELVGRLD